MRETKKNRERQSTYSMLYSYAKKDLKAGLLTGLIALVLALFAMQLNGFFRVVLSLISLVIAGGETLSHMLKKKKKSRPDDSLLILLAIVISFFLEPLGEGRYALAALAMSVYKLSNIGLTYLTGKLGKTMKDAAEVLPLYANLVDSDATIRKVQASSLTRGMKIIIKTGETVPADSVIVDGFSTFDTSNISISEHFVSLSAGDRILAGYINDGPSVTCEVECDGDTSVASDMRLIASMAERSGTKIEKRFSSIAKWYPPAVLFLAVLVILIGGFTTGAWSESMLRASRLLIAAATGSYVIAAPLVTASTVWNLKRKGLALSSGDMIDDLADVNCVAFDKKGVLTEGIYKITNVATTEGVSEDDFLMILANCIGERQHPISKLLTPYKNHHIPVEDVLEFPGKGMECTIMGKAFLCGSETFITECGGNVGNLKGYNLYITIDGEVMGALSIEDSLKDDTKEQIDALREVGIERIIMLTPERKEVAEAAFVSCGADEFFADLSSYERAEVVAKLKKTEDTTVCFIGDATNDSHAMDEADVGVSIVNLNEGRIKHSKTSLLGGFKTLAEAIEIARLACGKIELHFYCATAVKIILVLLALFGAINVASAILIDALLSAAALLSAEDLMKK